MANGIDSVDSRGTNYQVVQSAQMSALRKAASVNGQAVINLMARVSAEMSGVGVNFDVSA